MTSDRTVESATLRDYLLVARRRRWIILQAVVLVPAAAIAFSLNQETRYQATADVLLRGSLSLSGIGDGSLSSDPGRVAQTQADLARVPEVAQRVAATLGVAGLDGGRVLAQTSVTPKANTDLLSFSAVDADPLVARRIATQYAREFTRYKTELDTAAIRRARADFAKRLRQLEIEGRRSSRLYDSLAEKEQELATAEALQTTSAFVARTADYATRIQPRPKRDGVLGLLLGVVLGVGLAFVRETLDNRVRSTEEVERLLRLPFLAALPTPSRHLRREGRLVMVADPAGPGAEAFRMLRTNLDFVRLRNNPRTIMVTSAVEQEGKSTTAANLAVALARAGSNVILVDLDLRHPFLEKLLKIGDVPGVTEVALGRARLEKALVPVPLEDTAGRQDGGASGALDTLGRAALEEAAGPGSLRVVAAGRLPPNPGEFVGLPVIARLLGELAERADVVLIDAPPILHVGDTMTLSTHVDAILVVARTKLLRRPMLLALRRLLEASPAQALGFVVTGEDPGGVAYGYGYGQAHRSSQEHERLEEALR